MQEYHWNILLTFAGLLLGGGGALGAVFTYKLGIRQSQDNKDIAKETQKDANGLELIEKAFKISEEIQDNLRKDLMELRQQIKDTQGMIDLLVSENKKLLLENDKLMRANHELTEENNMLLKENKALGEKIIEVTERMTTLEQAVRAAPSVLDVANGQS